MSNIKFIKTLTSAVILSATTYLQAHAACPSGYTSNGSSGYCVKTNACGGKCTYTYDPESADIWATKNANVPAGEAVLMDEIIGTYSGFSVHNVTVGEGITGFAGDNWPLFNVQAAKGRGTLTLPSTFKSGGHAGYTSNFATYDLSAMKDTSLKIGSSGSYNIILSDGANLNLSTFCPYDNCAPVIDMICKGNKRDCRSQLKNIASVYWNGSHTQQVTTSYYSGLDENGKYIEWSDDGLAVYADSTKAKPLGTYDFDGNAIDSYSYDGAGNLTAAYKNGVATYKKTSYTPAEAAAAVHKGNDNTIKFTFK